MAEKKRSKMRNITVMALLAVFVAAVVIVIANKAKNSGLSSPRWMSNSSLSSR